MGEVIGCMIEEEVFLYCEMSVFVVGYWLGVLIMIYVFIG